MRVRAPHLFCVAGLLIAAVLTVSPTFAAHTDVITRQLEFRAEALSISDPTGDLHVKVSDQPRVKVHLRGAKRAVDAVDAKLEGRTLVITQKADQLSHIGPSVIQVGGGASSIVIGSGLSQVIVVSGNRQGKNAAGITMLRIPGDSLDVSVTVPRGTPIRTRGLVGDVDIADTDASVRLAIEAADVSLGRIRDALLEITGSGDIEAASAEGNLDLRCPGSGSVRVHGGEIDVLNVALDGACDIRIDARAQHATLELRGAGDIYVEEVAARPVLNEDGVGSIVVGNWLAGE